LASFPPFPPLDKNFAGWKKFVVLGDTGRMTSFSARVCGWATVCALAVSMGVAQQPVSATGTGTVTGHVTYGDTQRPARFAHVALFGVPAQVTTAPKTDPNADESAQLAAAMASLKSMSTTNMVQAQTGTDGAFVATDVAPGDYYVFAGDSGYISPLNQVEALIQAGADVTKPLPGIPVVHVAAERTSMADVTMQRGAAVSGVVLWDDGSPVSGAIMQALPAKGDTKPPQQFAMLAMTSMLGSFSITDDLGHFRISGLAPGDYLVLATIKSGGQSGLGSGMNLSKMMANKPLLVYAPAAFHKTDAKAVTLHVAEDLRDQQITLNLAGLHSVSGRVTSAEDHHGINSATVRLQDSVDKEFVRSAPVDAAGNFTVTYLPPGTYELKVSDAEDTEPAKKDPKAKPKLFSDDKTLRSYAAGKMTVVVLDSDVTGQNLELAVDKNPKKDADFSKMFDDDDKPASKP